MSKCIYMRSRPSGMFQGVHQAHCTRIIFKDMEGRQPRFAEVFRAGRKHEKKGNPWNSRTTSPETADYITIDLDPSDGDFKKAIKAALAAKTIFDENNIKTFVKTSGKTGPASPDTLHRFYIPASTIYRLLHLR